VNMDALKPAALYPFVTGLRFLPAFVVVFVYFVILGARNDSGLLNSSIHRRAYISLAVLFILLTVIAVAIGYGDYHIWKAEVPERMSIAASYAAVYAINIAVAVLAFGHFNREQVSEYNRLFGLCALAFVALTIPAVIIDHQYNEVNRHHIDKRRPDVYVALNPDAIVDYRQHLASLDRRTVGPDFAALVNDREFERALRHAKFYKQEFDEPFQLLHRSAIFAYRANTPAMNRREDEFVFVRLPSELVLALRFQPAAD